jgi:hypothetical protein
MRERTPSTVIRDVAGFQCPTCNRMMGFRTRLAHMPTCTGPKPQKSWRERQRDKAKLQAKLRAMFPQ